MELHLPDELGGIARFAWAEIGRNCYRLGLGQGEYLTCALTLLERWEVVLGSRHSEVDGSMVATERQFAAAIAKAEDYVRHTRARALDLVDLQAAWRRRPATEKQLERLKRAHVSPPPKISRGQASHLIAMLPHEFS
jgi:hypothetical protein